MAAKKKTYVLMVSANFPAKHPKAGRPTFFKDSILESFKPLILWLPKVHTIRKNYELWKKRIDEVNAGNAVLSLRQWQGKPYQSKQIEFLNLGKGKVGIQKVDMSSFLNARVEGRNIDYNHLANNDGLSFKEFDDWFKIKDTSNHYAIIHFTDFRY